MSISSNKLQYLSSRPRMALKLIENTPLSPTVAQGLRDSFKRKSGVKLLQYKKNIKENLPELEKQEAKWVNENIVRANKMEQEDRFAAWRKSYKMQNTSELAWPFGNKKKGETSKAPTILETRTQARPKFIRPPPTTRPTLGDAIEDVKDRPKSLAALGCSRPMVHRPHVPKGERKNKKAAFPTSPEQLRSSLKRKRVVDESEDEELDQPPAKKSVRWNDEATQTYLIHTRDDIPPHEHGECMEIQPKPIITGPAVTAVGRSLPPVFVPKRKSSEWQMMDEANAARKARVSQVMALSKWVHPDVIDRLIKSTSAY